LKELQPQITHLLRLDGESLAITQRCMQSETRWSQWKSDGCASIVRKVGPEDHISVTKAELKPIRRRYRPKPYPGRAQLESMYSDWKGGESFLSDLKRDTKPTPSVRDIMSQMNNLDGSDRSGLKETFAWIAQRALLRDAMDIHTCMQDNDEPPSSLEMERYLIPVLGEDAVVAREEPLSGAEDEMEIDSS
jgi:hypothetical protein